MRSAIFSASVMLRMAMPAWLATEASRRLSLVEYGSSESRAPSTIPPCSSPSLEPRIGTMHSGCSGSNCVP